MILGVSHLAVRTNDLPLTISFYTRILGLAEMDRPKSMDFPGAWIALPAATGEAILHVYAGSAAGPVGDTPAENDHATVDHLALSARGFGTLRSRMRRFGLNWRELHREGRSVWQMFVHDPNGLKIELSFSRDDDPELPIPVDDTRLYTPSERFFDPAGYARLLSPVDPV